MAEGLSPDDERIMGEADKLRNQDRMVNAFEDMQRKSAEYHTEQGNEVEAADATRSADRFRGLGEAVRKDVIQHRDENLDVYIDAAHQDMARAEAEQQSPEAETDE